MFDKFLKRWYTIYVAKESKKKLGDNMNKFELLEMMEFNLKTLLMNEDCKKVRNKTKEDLQKELKRKRTQKSKDLVSFQIEMFDFEINKLNETAKKHNENQKKENGKYDRYSKMINLVESTEEIEDYIWSKSPHGDSFYYHHKDEKITWGHKPEKSLRVSDHWNWDNGSHCPVLGANEETIEAVKLAKFENGYYKFM
jgi:hypothetical protein